MAGMVPNESNQIGLSIRQEPVHAKAIGFKQQFGNYVDPALIVELTEFDNLDNKSRTGTGISITDLICVVGLRDGRSNVDKSTVILPARWEEDEERNENESNSISNSIKLISNIRGQRIKHAVQLTDPVDGIEKPFFIFDDLAIRTQGHYCLSIQILHVSSRQYGFLEMIFLHLLGIPHIHSY
jgi:hypothetical protein